MRTIWGEVWFLFRRFKMGVVGISTDISRASKHARCFWNMALCHGLHGCRIQILADPSLSFWRCFCSPSLELDSKPWCCPGIAMPTLVLFAPVLGNNALWGPAVWKRVVCSVNELYGSCLSLAVLPFDDGRVKTMVTTKQRETRTRGWDGSLRKEALGYFKTMKARQSLSLMVDNSWVPANAIRSWKHPC